MRTAIVISVVMLVGLQLAAAHSSNTRAVKAQCEDDARSAIIKAQQYLEQDSPLEDRHAIVCAVEAIAIMERKLQGLSDGSMAFDGVIHAPKGVVMMKPSDQEGR